MAQAARCVSAHKCEHSGHRMEEDTRGPVLLNAFPVNWMNVIKHWVKRTSVGPVCCPPGAHNQKSVSLETGRQVSQEQQQHRALAVWRGASLPVGLVGAMQGMEPGRTVRMW